MSDSALPKKSTNNTETQFTSQNIGKWASKQENPFAEQNRKAAAKKQKKAETRKKATPYVVIAAAIVAVGLAVFGLVMLIIAMINSQPKLPDDITLGSEGAAEISDAAQNIYQEQLKNFYNQHGDRIEGSPENPSQEAIDDALNAVGDYYNEQKDKAKDEVVKAQLALIEMRTYAFKGREKDLVRVGEGINVDIMQEFERNEYWGMMANAYYSLGDNERGAQAIANITNVLDGGN